MAQINIRYELDTTALDMSIRSFVYTVKYGLLLLANKNPIQSWYKFRLDFLPFETSLIVWYKNAKRELKEILK